VKFSDQVNYEMEIFPFFVLMFPQRCL